MASRMTCPMVGEVDSEEERLWPVPTDSGGGYHGVWGKLLVEPAILSDFKLIHFQYSALQFAMSHLDVDMVAREVLLADEVRNLAGFLYTLKT